MYLSRLKKQLNEIVTFLSKVKVVPMFEIDTVKLCGCLEAKVSHTDSQTSELHWNESPSHCHATPATLFSSQNLLQ